MVSIPLTQVKQHPANQLDVPDAIPTDNVINAASLALVAPPSVAIGVEADRYSQLVDPDDSQIVKVKAVAAICLTTCVIIGIAFTSIWLNKS